MHDLIYYYLPEINKKTAERFMKFEPLVGKYNR